MPLSLYALAAHFAGDFPLQTDAMAAKKFDDPVVRVKHVLVYTATFLPVVRAARWNHTRSGVFLTVLGLSHFVIDSRRWKEPVEGFPTLPIWFDQAYHIIALALAVALASKQSGQSDENRV